MINCSEDVFCKMELNLCYIQKCFVVRLNEKEEKWNI